NVRLILLPECLTDLRTHALDVGQVQAAVTPARRSNRNQRDLGVPHCLRRVRRGSQAARSNHLLHQLPDSLLHNRRLAGVHEINLRGTNVYSDNGMAFLCEAGCGYTTHIAKSEYANLAHS